jgi:hypothetical protein
MGMMFSLCLVMMLWDIMFCGKPALVAAKARHAKQKFRLQNTISPESGQEKS